MLARIKIKRSICLFSSMCITFVEQRWYIFVENSVKILLLIEEVLLIEGFCLVPDSARVPRGINSRFPLISKPVISGFVVRALPILYYLNCFDIFFSPLSLSLILNFRFHRISMNLCDDVILIKAVWVYLNYVYYYIVETRGKSVGFLI